MKFEKESGEKLRYEAIEWENKFQLTESGQLPVDIGFLLELEREGYLESDGFIAARRTYVVGPAKTLRHILWQGFQQFFHAVNPREIKILVIET